VEPSAAPNRPNGDDTVSFLLDTDICSAYLKGNHRVGNRVTQYGGGLHVSAITAAELFTWVLRKKASPTHLQGLVDLLKDVAFLEVNRDVSHKFGEIRAHQLDQGTPTPEIDLLIAATAIVHGLTLVTHNVDDYANVPELQVADWLAN
jgi:tRNA(fMet)-specific endonuclease VapC